MAEAIINPTVGGPLSSTPATPDDLKRQDIIQTLQTYMAEAKQARLGGYNPRDAKWSENLDLYWNRWDFSQKADWQAKETMPEVPSFVDRFAAALKEALVATPQGFYAVLDPSDKEGDLTGAIKKMMDVWLTKMGASVGGQPLDFSSVFQEQMTMGALMACAATVTWKEDGPKGQGRVAVETVDPRGVWFDHTGRDLYRIRRIEIDRHDLREMMGRMDKKGRPIFDLRELDSLVSSFDAETANEKMEASGHGTQIISPRKPVTLDEYVATVLGPTGERISDRGLYVVANERFLLRGPEANPFWHGQDWLVYTPLVPTPLSVYGRSYMEDFGSIAKTFNELTNMILDAVHVTALKVFAVVPDMLRDPRQLAEGLSPGKTFFLDGIGKPDDFAKALDLGTLPAEAVRVWEAMKAQLTEAAGVNEIGLGQFAPKGRTSATEVTEAQQNSSALIRSVSQTIETRFLDTVLNLGWKTGLQHVKPDDPFMAEMIGPELWTALITQRKQLIQRPITFQARGISAMIERSRMLKALLGILQVIGANDILMQEFLKEVSPEKLVKKLFELSSVDMNSLALTEREKAIRSMTEQMSAMAKPGTPAPSPQGQQAVQGAVSAAGLAPQG